MEGEPSRSWPVCLAVNETTGSMVVSLLEDRHCRST